MKAGEAIRIKAGIGGVTRRELASALGISEHRAQKLLRDIGDVDELHELRQQARDYLRDATPCPAGVAHLLARESLAGPIPGHLVRWTRVILHVGLREWSRLHGYTPWWWSKFETDPDFAEAGLPRLTEFQHAALRCAVDLAREKIKGVLPCE